MKRACVSVTHRSVFRIRLWPVRRDDISRVLIGAAGVWRSDWRRRTVGAPIGRRARSLLALAREAIDSMRAGAATSCFPMGFVQVFCAGNTSHRPGGVVVYVIIATLLGVLVLYPEISLL